MMHVEGRRAQPSGKTTSTEEGTTNEDDWLCIDPTKCTEIIRPAEGFPRQCKNRPLRNDEKCRQHDARRRTARTAQRQNDIDTRRNYQRGRLAVRRQRERETILSNSRFGYPLCNHFHIDSPIDPTKRPEIIRPAEGFPRQCKNRPLRNDEKCWHHDARRRTARTAQRQNDIDTRRNYQRGRLAVRRQRERETILATRDLGIHVGNHFHIDSPINPTKCTEIIRPAEGFPRQCKNRPLRNDEKCRQHDARRRTARTAQRQNDIDTRRNYQRGRLAVRRQRERETILSNSRFGYPFCNHFHIDPPIDPTKCPEIIRPAEGFPRQCKNRPLRNDEKCWHHDARRRTARTAQRQNDIDTRRNYQRGRLAVRRQRERETIPSNLGFGYPCNHFHIDSPINPTKCTEIIRPAEGFPRQCKNRPLRNDEKCRQHDARRRTARTAQRQNDIDTRRNYQRGRLAVRRQRERETILSNSRFGYPFCNHFHIDPPIDPTKRPEIIRPAEGFPRQCKNRPLRNDEKCWHHDARRRTARTAQRQNDIDTRRNYQRGRLAVRRQRERETIPSNSGFGYPCGLE
ncbi:hypothetical protein RRG08_034047 [Elysia crispata]|uniref:Uncharacterized protein n=1 Tax=Elysia crispata TaxID=231223 RepID=A0AAE0YKG6_9GAST|nr:hypothetical protein RRG08_034047 [Elysia crispata]